jgi:Poxvirus Late Transcription Factor VLTF3 like
MYNIENTHNRVLDKIAIVRTGINGIITHAEKFNKLIPDAKAAQVAIIMSGLRLNILLGDIDAIETAYMLAVTQVLGEYYSQSDRPGAVTKYYRVLASENTIGQTNNVIVLCKTAITKFGKALRLKAIPVRDQDLFDDELEIITADFECALNIDANEHIEKRNVDVCKCGERMRLIQDVSELRCDSCLRTKKVLGSVLHYDQTHDNQKSKHNEYDVVRHLRFHLEHLQALEAKTFDKGTLDKIAYVIKRDGIVKTSLNCEIMRHILKDPYVDATHLNNHAPLLIKTFGGRGPPTFDYDELKVLKTRFIRVTNVHAELNPFGGNTPYYPHFIYKIAEVQFMSDPEKLRILEFIHLQSAETVEKNDQYFEDVCNAVNDPSSGLSYKPTDISSRF